MPLLRLLLVRLQVLQEPRRCPLEPRLWLWLSICGLLSKASLNVLLLLVGSICRQGTQMQRALAEETGAITPCLGALRDCRVPIKAHPDSRWQLLSACVKPLKTNKHSVIIHVLCQPRLLESSQHPPSMSSMSASSSAAASAAALISPFVSVGCLLSEALGGPKGSSSFSYSSAKSTGRGSESSASRRCHHPRHHADNKVVESPCGVDCAQRKVWDVRAWACTHQAAEREESPFC